MATLPPPSAGYVGVPSDGHRSRGDPAVHVPCLLQPGGGGPLAGRPAQPLQLRLVQRLRPGTVLKSVRDGKKSSQKATSEYHLQWETYLSPSFIAHDHWRVIILGEWKVSICRENNVSPPLVSPASDCLCTVWKWTLVIVWLKGPTSCKHLSERNSGPIPQSPSHWHSFPKLFALFSVALMLILLP